MTGLFSAQVIYLNGTPCILSSINDITERKLIEEALRSSQEQLKKYTSHLQNLREEDRISLAREIHDEMGQILIAIRFEVGMIKQKVIKGDEKSTPENLLPNIEHLMTLVDQTIKTTRKIMIDLRSEENEKFEFIEAVNIYAVEFEKRYKIECVVICDLEKLSVNSQKSIALFRIFQEALSNVVRHAKASRVEVHIQVIKKIFRLEISDNGVGYKSEQKAKPKSFGILGIKERVSMLEGEFDISSSIGKGTKLKIEIPYLN